jgi:hypothetical protein
MIRFPHSRGNLLSSDLTQLIPANPKDCFFGIFSICDLEELTFVKSKHTRVVRVMMLGGSSCLQCLRSGLDNRVRSVVHKVYL